MTSPPENVDRSISWTPKVEPWKLRRVYESYAKGIVDEEAIDGLGCALYARCRDIWCVTETRCQHCRGRLGREVIGGYACYRCVSCGWAIRKRRYKSSYKGKRLIGGSAYPAFLVFLREFESAKTAHAKMLAIDRLVHAFHGDYTGPRSRLRRTACVSVFKGTGEELKALLDDLAYGDTIDREMAKNRETWRRKQEEKRRLTE